MTDVMQILGVAFLLAAAALLVRFLRGKLAALKKRDCYLLAAIANLTWYCVAVLVLTAHGQTVPDSLTVAWFAAWTAELALLAGIKIKGKNE